MPLFLAEIADKEPSVLQLWIVAIVLSTAAATFARWRRWAVLVPFALAAVWLAAVFAELRDPHVGPAILQELGRGYVVQSVVAVALPFLFGLAALFFTPGRAKA